MTLEHIVPLVLACLGVLIACAAVYGLATFAVARAVRRVSPDDAQHKADVEAWAKEVNQVARIGTGVAAVLGVASAVLTSLGFDGIPSLTLVDIVLWLRGPGTQIVLVVVGAVILHQVLRLVTAGLPTLLVGSQGRAASEVEEQRKRIATIGSLLFATANVLLLGAALLVILRGMGVDVMPILTGAGVLGLAVSFGAQNLVRDVISGVFLIAENNIRVGDTASINGLGGTVEHIRLRTTVLRDVDGTVHVIPNGAITQLSNMSKDFSYWLLDMSIAYDEDTDRVADTMRRVAAELQTDAEFGARILAPLEVMGVHAFLDSAVSFRVRLMTMPGQQWAVGRELQRRLKKAFDTDGIEIPFPQLVLRRAEAS